GVRQFIVFDRIGFPRFGWPESNLETRYPVVPKNSRRFHRRLCPQTCSNLPENGPNRSSEFQCRERRSKVRWDPASTTRGDAGRGDATHSQLGPGSPYTAQTAACGAL